MFGEKFEGDVERSPLKKKKDLYWWKWRQEASLMTSHLYFCQTSDKKLMLSNLKYFSRFATFVKFATLQGVLVWVHFKTNSLFSSNSPLNRGRVSLISHSEFSPTLWQMFAKCPIFARFAIFVKFALVVNYWSNWAPLNIPFEFSPILIFAVACIFGHKCIPQLF